MAPKRAATSDLAPATVPRMPRWFVPHIYPPKRTHRSFLGATPKMVGFILVSFNQHAIRGRSHFETPPHCPIQPHFQLFHMGGSSFLSLGSPFWVVLKGHQMETHQTHHIGGTLKKDTPISQNDGPGLVNRKT